ncbi:hypothetical protein C0995_002359 [Termitomyces sp. Mi166|nr:hypothetical protein C0995_002359 [Termitomyces sp. Mi166\
MFEPVRGGTRGGQAEFKWSDVSADKDREHYLGHSINAPTGRWQKNKDVHWYNREGKQSQSERDEEIRKIKELEADALAVALGFEPAKKMAAPSGSPTAAATSPGGPASPTVKQKAIEDAEAKAREKEERRKRKEARREEKRARKEARRLKDRSRSRSPIPRRRDIDRERDLYDDREGSPRRASDSYRERRDRSRSPRHIEASRARSRSYERSRAYERERDERREYVEDRRRERPRNRESGRLGSDYDEDQRERERERDRRLWVANNSRRHRQGERRYD